MTNDTIILGDIHGCFNTMVRLLNRAPKGVKVVFHGDLIDRGPHSRKVVEFAMQNGIATCCGNHEDLAMAFYRGGRAHCNSYYDRGVWLDNGGDKAVRDWPTIDKRTLSGPEIAQAEYVGGRVPEEVLDWMEGLPAYLFPSEQVDENGRRLLVSHTGYGLNADSDHWFSALWGRRRFGDGPWARDPDTGEEKDDGHFRVYGHTQAKDALLTDREAMIDTGAAYGSRGYGILTALLWPTKTLLQQPYDETPCQPAFQIIDGRLADLP